MSKKPKGTGDNCTAFPFFPVPASGETVYSVFCRCVARSGLPYTYLLSKLTGQKYKQCYLSVLPGYLNHLSKRIRFGHPWCDASEIVRAHTNLPYFSYFDPPEVREQLNIELAETESPKHTVMSLGLTKIRCGAAPAHPRFCPSCADEDRKSLGFTYFRREHQLPGVALCWLHETALAHGCTKCGPYPINGKAFSMPGSCACTDRATPLLAHTDLPENKEPLIWLAQQSAFMVNSKGAKSGNIREDLRTLALEQGLGRKSLLEPGRIAEAIEKRFGQQTLEWLKTPVWTNGRPSPWLSRLFHSQQKRSPGIYFLLFIATAFDSMEEFEAALASPSRRKTTRYETATRAISAQLEVSSNAGRPTWSEELSTLLKTSSYGLPGLSTRLGVPIGQIVGEIRQRGWRLPLSKQTRKKLGNEKIDAIKGELRLGLDKTEITRNHGCTGWGLTLIELDEPGISEIHYEAARLITRERNRSRLCEYLTANPTATRSDVLNALSGVYDYLLRLDKDWFYEQIPERKKADPVPRNAEDAWPLIDRQKTEEIEKAFEEMLAPGPKPVWASASAVLKKAHFHQKYTNGPHRFPKVTEVLQQKAESRPDFIRRRLAWAIEKLASSDTPVSLARLYRIAALPSQTVREYKQCVIDLVRELNAQISGKSFFT